MAGGITLARGIIEGFREIWMDLLKKKKKVVKLFYGLFKKKVFRIVIYFFERLGECFIGCCENDSSCRKDFQCTKF